MLHCCSHKLVQSPRRRWWVALVLGLCGAVGAQETVLYLRNGDRISGRILAEGTNVVTIATAFSEGVAIPVALIERRESGKKPAVVSTNETIRPTTPASGVVSELILTNKPSLVQAVGGSPKPSGAKPPQPQPAEAKPPEAKPPEPSGWQKFIDEWRGEAQLGANLAFSTKERETFTGRIQLTHNHSFPNQRAMRNILGYDVSYGTTDHERTDNRMDGTWKVEYDMTKRILAYNATRAGYDEIRGIDLQYDFGPGMGYKWLVRTNLVLKTELGGDYQEQYFTTGRHSTRYSLRLAEELWWQITPKLRWDEKVEFFPALSQDVQYRVRLETNLSYLLRQNLTLTLNVIDLYDTDVPPDISKNDLQIRSLLGLKF